MNRRATALVIFAGLLFGLLTHCAYVRGVP